MRRTKAEAEQTRERILEVGERLFRAKGVTAVSVEEIAQVSGFSRGAVHWHFRDKQGLLLALADRRGLPIQQLAQRLQIDPELDAIDEFVAVVGRELAAMERDAVEGQLETILRNVVAVESPDLVGRFERGLREAITAIFAVAEQNRRLKPEWPAATAGLACYGLVSGLVNTWLQGQAGYGLGDVDRALRAFIAAVSTPRPGSG